MVSAGRRRFIDSTAVKRLNAFLFEIVRLLMRTCTYALMCAKHRFRTYLWCVGGENLIVLLVVVLLAFI